MGRFEKTLQSFAAQERDSRYVFVFLGSVFIFLITGLQVLSAGLFDSIERPVFDYFNSLPNVLHGIMYCITQLGGLGGLVFWVLAGWYLVKRRGAITVAIAGILAWPLAQFAKALFHRDRPQGLLDQVNLFNGGAFSGFGFPSGHCTFAAACATALYFQVPRKYRKYLIIIVILVGISRMYLGAHFPLDVVGGWALGAFIGSLVMVAAGVTRKSSKVPDH